MRKTNKILIWISGFLLALALTLFPSAVLANIGLPMIFLIYPASLVAIIPIVIIEANVYSKSLNLKLEDAFLCSIIANLISTLAGFPLLWISGVGVLRSLSFLSSSSSHLFSPLFDEIVLWLINIIAFPFWLGPGSQKEMIYAVPASAILFLIIAYFLSVFVEKNCNKISFSFKQFVRSSS